MFLIVVGVEVLEVISIDGIKMRMGLNYWLMLCFFGMELLLWFYCEGLDVEWVNEVFIWV